MKLKIVLIGAGSVEFGPGTINDILLSDPLNEKELELVLMDIDETRLSSHREYALEVSKKLKRNPEISYTTNLEKALDGADFVISSFEVKRYYYWSQDFHIPRKYGIMQVYGENGGPGGLFHALRGFEPTLELVQKMEKLCPNAWLLNFSNPLTKLSELINRSSSIKWVGLCHGVFQGIKQLSKLLEIPIAELDAKACGLNHFTWFQSIKRKSNGKDLYPLLLEKEKKAHWLAEWDEIALSRMLLRLFGLYPSPGANHIGEYISWARDFLGSSMLQYFYDPKNQDPWKSENIPTFLYNLDTHPTGTPMYPEKEINTIYPKSKPKKKGEIRPSGELAIPIIEGIHCGHERQLAAVNVENTHQLIPGLPDEAVVEVPALVNKNGLHAMEMDHLPEAVLAMMRTQCSINKLLVEAFEEKSRNKLLQAMLLEPSCTSYSAAVHCINEMMERQKEHLPELHW